MLLDLHLHSTASDGQYTPIKQYRRLATNLELIITAGSDYHGEKIKSKNILGMDVKEEKMNYCWGYSSFMAHDSK